MTVFCPDFLRLWWQVTSTWQIKSTEIASLLLLEAGSPRSRCWQGRLAWRPGGRLCPAPPPLLVVPVYPQRPLPPSAHTALPMHLLCVLRPSPLSRKAAVAGRPAPALTAWHLVTSARSCFQMGSHSQALGAGRGRFILEDTAQLTAGLYRSPKQDDVKKFPKRSRKS